LGGELSLVINPKNVIKLSGKAVVEEELEACNIEESKKSVISVESST
jgi:hypothetical protein